METRMLKPEEYGLMDSIPEPNAVRLDPANTWVVAGFDGGRLVGRLIAINLPHLECLWIDEEHRKSTLGYTMERMMIERLQSIGAKKVLAFAVDEEMEDYCRRLGYQKFATAWEKEI